MYKTLFLLCAIYSLAAAGPLNLFVNVTIDDRPDLDIVEGDIAFEANTPRNAYTVAAKWTNGILPYVIDSASPFTQAHISTITSAMRKIEEQTNNCIRFVPRTNQATWLRIFSGTGCWSFMGRTKTSGAQDLSIGLPGCAYQDIAIHELLHAVGFAHEQTRPDRDNHVTINWGNIQSGTESNFQAYSTSQVSTLGRGYDMSSVMHYRWNAFSKNGLPTIVPKQSTIDRNVLGSSKVMTNLDIQKVKAYYGCA